MTRPVLASLVSLSLFGCAAPAATTPAPTNVYGSLDARATPLPVTKSSTRDPEERPVVAKPPADAPVKPEPAKDEPKDDAPKDALPPEAAAQKEGESPKDAPSATATKNDPAKPLATPNPATGTQKAEATKAPSKSD